MPQTLADLASQLQQQAQGPKQLTFDSNLITGCNNYLAVLMLVNTQQSFTLSFQDVTQDISYNSANNTLTITGTGTLYTIGASITLVLQGIQVSTVTCNLSTTFASFPLNTLNNAGLLPAGKVTTQALGLFTFSNVTLSINSPAQPSNPNIFASYQLNVATSQLDNPIPIVEALGLSLNRAGLTFQRTINNAGVFDYSLVISGSVNVGPMALTISLTAPVSYFTSGIWTLQFDSAGGNKAVDLQNLVQVLAGTNPFSNLPPGLSGLSVLGKLTLQTLQVKFGFADPTSPQIYSIYTLITVFDQQNNNSWEVMTDPVKFVIADAGFSITVTNPFDKTARDISVYIYGNFVIGSSTPVLLLNTSMMLDITTGDWVASISGDFKNNGFTNLFSALPLLNDQQAPDFPVGLQVTEIKLNQLTIAYNAAPNSKTISLVAFDIETVLIFSITLGPLTLSIQNPYARFNITNPASAANRQLTGTVGGTLGIGSTNFDLSASKDAPDAGWVFLGTMQPHDEIKLGDIVTTFLSAIGIQNIPSWVQNNLPVITAFSASITTAPASNPSLGSSYALKGSADWKLNFDSFIHDVDLKADIDITYNSTTKAFKGSVIGYTTLNDVLTIGLGYTFSSDPTAAGLITVIFDGIQGTYNTATGDIQITFKDQTVGSIITHLMQTIDASFTLTPPWNFLDDIKLSGFSMTFNIGKKTVSITYTASIDLGFLKINSFSLVKAPDPASGESRVTINIDGTFLGMSTNSPTSPLNGPQDVRKLPSVPGKGNDYFNLNLLALGQRVQIQNAGSFKSVEDVMQALIKLDNPPQGVIPLSPGKTGVIWYNPDSNWLMASKFGILKLPTTGQNTATDNKPSYAIEMDIVFNDPAIYGLLLRMSGDKVKIFDGLKFEILYKKISDSVGVYQIDFTLPAAIRNLDFGEFSIVLPSISVMIYTNGDFLVDIGFPYNNDFSQSFTVSAIIVFIPVLGSGGFYFGKLSSATSDQVPKSTKGQFNPVMVFGIGMQLGLGYTFNKGILSAGFSLTILGILEGVIAKWHAYDNVESGSKTQVQDSYYFWIRGTVGIMGKLYGSINFAIIKASLNVTIYATLSTTYESYRKMPIVLTLGISVELSVKIDLWLFSITIHLSFSAQLHEEFSIGHDHIEDAPWYDGSQKMLLFRRRIFTMSTPVASSFHFDYLVGDGNPQQLTIYFAPHLTISGTPGGALSGQSAQYVAMTYIDTIKQGSTPAGTTSFELLSLQVFRWLVSSYIATAPVTPEQLDAMVVSDQQLAAIYQYLSENTLPLATKDITDFLGRLFKVDIEAPVDNGQQKDLSVTVFPVFPFMELSVPAYGTAPLVDRKFSDYIQCTTGYIQTLQTYFDKVMVTPGEGANSAASLSADDPTLLSVTDIVFRDFFVLIARQTIQAARDILKTYSYTVNKNDSIGSIVSSFNELAPSDGTSNKLTAEEIGTLNSGIPLTGNQSLVICSVQHTVAAGDTITGVAQAYGMTDAAFATLFATQAILTTGAQVSYNNQGYTVQANDTLQKIATHYNTDVQTLVGNNGNLASLQGLLATAALLCIAGYAYKVKNNDKLSAIQSNYNALAPVTANNIVNQNMVMQGLIQKNVKITIGSNPPYTTQPGDTFASIAAAFPSVQFNDLVTALQDIQGLMVPLATLYIPLLSYTTAAGNTDTLQSIASKFIVTTSQLVEVPANAALQNIFYTGGSIMPVLQLTSLDCAEISEIVSQLTTGNSINQLSGMSSRFLLHGLRLPVTSDLVMPASAACSGQSFCSLYNLTGQQFALPAAFSATDYTITLQVDGSYQWMLFNGVPGSSIQVTLKQNDAAEAVISNILSYAVNTGIKPGIQALSTMSVYAETGATFTFRTATRINAAEALTLPAGGTIPQGIAPLIWGFPPALTTVINQPKTLNPLFNLLIGSGGIIDDTTPAVQTFGWGTTVSITLKKLPSAGPFCYELTGADETGVVLLQRLLAFCYPPGAKQPDTSFINDLYLLYGINGALNYDGNDAITSFIINSNLSTDTNPPPGVRSNVMRNAAALSGFLNSDYDFLRLLWECSVVRSGGFYLYYNNNGSGFPDQLFGQNESATINLVILYNSTIHTSPQGALYNFMNCIVTGDNIDTSKNTVIAQSQQQQYVYPVKGPVALSDLVASFNMLLGDLAILNQALPLSTTSLQLTIPAIYYEMKATDTLTSVATYFSAGAQTPVTVAQLQQQNPGVTPGPMALLYIGDIIYNVSTTAGGPGNQLQSIAAYYGVDMNALAYANKDVPGIFPVNTNLSINDQLISKTPSLPPGAGGFVMTRDNPGDVPAPSDPGYAAAYLLNTYNLLAFSVSTNAYFGNSIPGLPAGPNQDNPLMKLVKPGDPVGLKPWQYGQAVMLANYATKRNIIDQAGLPPASANPYAGAGKVAQLFLDWEDMFGNETVTPFNAPQLLPGSPMNNLPVLLGYTDLLLPVLAWPSTYTYYTVWIDPANTAKAPELRLGLLFDTSRYTVSSQNGVDPATAKANAANDLAVYETVYYQVNQVAEDNLTPLVTFILNTSLLTGSSLTLTAAQYKTITGFVSQAYLYLAAIANNTTPVNPPAESPLVFPIDLSQVNANSLFEISVSLVIQRNIDRVHPDFKDVQSTWYANSPVTPPTFPNYTNISSISLFATAFENALQSASYMIKVASSMPDIESGSSSRTVWGVRWGLQQGNNIWYQVNTTPLFFAVTPLANTLVSYPKVSIQTYTTGTGLVPGQFTDKAFTGIDMDTWGRSFLEAVENVLSAAYGVPGFIAGKLENAGKDYVQLLLDAKKDIAGAIADNVANVIAAPVPSAGQLQDAQDKMKQQFLNNLVNAYTIDVAIQYPVQVSSPYPGQGETVAPNLFGTPQATQASLQEDDDTENPYSLSTAKIALGNSNGLANPSYLTIMFTAKNITQQNVMTLDISYNATHIEHQIAPVPGIADYKSSAWLNFVIPPAPISAGTIPVPVLLRAYPTPPSLLTQLASPLDTITTIEEAKQWDYSFVYSCAHAAQDQINTYVEFNLQPDLNRKLFKKGKTKDLFEALAQFVSVYPQVQQDLATYLLAITPDTAVTDTPYVNGLPALQAFTTCVQDVATAWKTWTEIKGTVNAPDQTGKPFFSFAINEASDGGNAQVNISPTQTGIPGLNMPLIQIDPANYTPVPDTPAASYEYSKTNDPGKGTMLQEGQAQLIAPRTVSFDNLDILRFQNAQAAVYIERNGSFNGQTTNDDFVYKTPYVKFANKLVPLLNCNQPFNIASLGGGKASLAQHLSNLFQAVFADDASPSELVKVTCSYAYATNPAMPLITLPVLLATPFDFPLPGGYTIPSGGCTVVPPGTDCSTAGPVVCQLSCAITKWFTANLPSIQGAMYVFEVAVFSKLNPEQQLPLLSLGNLQLNISDIQ